MVCAKIYLVTISVFLCAQIIFLELYSLQSQKVVEFNEKSTSESNRQILFDKILSNHYSLCEYRLNYINRFSFWFYYLSFSIQSSFTMVGIVMELLSNVFMVCFF